MLVIVAILAAALWPEAVEVDVARVERGPMQVTIDEEGETRVRERFVVSAPVTGRLQRIELEPGDKVIRGQTVLARLAPAPPTLLDARTRAELTAAVEASRAALGAMRAERARAAATQARARSSLRRQEDLAEAGLISPDELEAAQTALRAADEALKAADFSAARAESDLQTARARLQQPEPGGRVTAIVSPIDGVVLKRLRESESVVQVGEPLVEVGNARQLEVVADLLSTDAVRVEPGAPVLFEQWGGGHTLTGKVQRIEPSGFMKVSALGVEEQRVNVIIDFVDPVAAAKALGDSYRVEVRIVIWQDNNALKVPVGSLFRRGDDWAVFAVEGGHAHVKTVEVGQRNSREAEVSGLAEGDEIVLHPPDTLEDGARVTERRD
ncbi:MAG: efflux RND transporter periplasmic adaptor subunit [Vicinamibacterales bacterium]